MLTMKCSKHHSESVSGAASPNTNLAENKDSDSQIQAHNQCRIS